MVSGRSLYISNIVYLYWLYQDSVIKVLDTLYHDRNYARFFVLETIARVPYFGECQHLFYLYISLIV